MTASVTINSVTTELYTASEVKALLVPVLDGIGTIDGVKYRFKIPTFRLFAAGKVMVAPRGFTWLPGVKAAATVDMKTRRNYFDKVFVDELVASLA